MIRVTTAEMKELDRKAIEDIGIPSLLLMENAGRGIADLAQSMLTPSGKVVVACGKGNNGGDGFVAARHLFNRGYDVTVLLLAGESKLKKDPKVNHEILQKMKVPVEVVCTEAHLDMLQGRLNSAQLVIDGILGVGLTRNVSGIFKDVIDAINRHSKNVLGVDIPSGLNSDTGEVLGVAVKCRQTGTLCAAKKGLFLADGPEYCGHISVLDISIPKQLMPLA